MKSIIISCTVKRLTALYHRTISVPAKRLCIPNGFFGYMQSNSGRGINSLITFHWDDTKKTLTISDRKGTFPGMLKERTFAIVIVDTTKGTGIEISREPNKVFHYIGNRSIAKLYPR